MRILFKLNPYLQQRQREKKRNIFPILLAMYATALRNQGNTIVWDKEDDETYDRVITNETQIDIPFLELPSADRILTDAHNPKWQRNGNFKHHAGTYIQSASGCVWGKCIFCVEKGIPYQVRPVDDVIREIRECKRLGYREIFDDAASFAVGEWRNEFVRKLRHLDVTFSCNMRFGTNPDFKKMRDAGFRMLLYGLESRNRETLDRINKGIKAREAMLELHQASEAGLEPHIAVMFGYPWETDADAIQTLDFVHWLLRKGYAKTAQASLYTPPINTPPYGESPALRALNTNFEHKKYVKQIYRAAFYPDFWLNRLKEIRNVDDIKYIWRGIKSCFGI